MECKWILENEKKIKSIRRKRIQSLAMVFSIIFIIFGYFYYKISNSPIEHRASALSPIYNSFICIIGVIIFTIFISFKLNKKNVSYHSLREELNQVLKTSEDFKLIDNEFYGNLKREVKLGINNFIFTPHFLIQKLDETKYKVIKLQNVSTVIISESSPSKETEFYDEFNKCLGKITNTEPNNKVFYNICREQIPWAKFLQG